MYQHIMFRLSTGALPISTLIEKRIREISGKEYPLLRIPVLMDTNEVRQEFSQTPMTLGSELPYIFWCGTVDGYIRDPLFLIRVQGVMIQKYAIKTRLVIAGPCSNAARKELLNEVSKAGLEPGDVIITGYIPENELFRLTTHAEATLLPLWDDDRSKTRFPTKLGLYVAAGRPIVTSTIGEIPHFLKDKETALFATANDEQSWAGKIASLIKNQDLSAQLVKRMHEDEVLQRIDYRKISSALGLFFNHIYATKAKSNGN